MDTPLPSALHKENVHFGGGITFLTCSFKLVNHIMVLMIISVSICRKKYRLDEAEED